MITKKAVRTFLAAPRNDVRGYKKLTEPQLEQLRKRLTLPAWSPLWPKLRLHQKICFYLGIKYHRFAFHLDTGCGKTLLSIALARMLRKLRVAHHFIVLVPNNINLYEWEQEILKHAPTTQYAILDGSSADKWQTLYDNAKATLLIITYAGLYHMVCEIKPTKKDKNRMVPVKAKVREVTRLVDGLIMDESNAVGNHDTLPFRICRQISKKAQAVFELSAYPFLARDPTPLWSQMLLIDWGESLGKNLGLFRRAFFSSKINYWSGFPEYTFKKTKKQELRRLLGHRSIYYAADKADLPAVVPIVKEIQLPDEAEAYYQKAKEKLIAAHGNFREQKNAFLRMRQISSGFIGYHDDELGTKARFEFTPNLKLELLLSIVESIQATYQIAVMYDFIFSGDMIARELKRMKIGFIQISGKHKKLIPQARTRFTTDPKCRVALVNTAGAYGVDFLKTAKHQIFYESPVSPLLRKQMERRVERQYSIHDKIMRWELIARGTVDQQIRDSHLEGEDLFEQIIKGKKPA